MYIMTTKHLKEENRPMEDMNIIEKIAEFFQENQGWIVVILGPPIAWFGARYVARKQKEEKNLELIDSRIAIENKALKLKIDKLTSELHVLMDKFNKLLIEHEVMKRTIAAGLNVDVENITIAKIQELASKRKTSFEEIVQFIKSAPDLLWMKRRVGPKDYVMVQVSDHYAELYLGKPASYYIGKRDSEIWSEAIAQEFAENDEATYVQGVNSKNRIRERIASPLTGATGYFIGKKWLLNINGESYVCGIGMHEPDRVSTIPEISESTLDNVINITENTITGEDDV